MNKSLNQNFSHEKSGILAYVLATLIILFTGSMFQATTVRFMSYLLVGVTAVLLLYLFTRFLRNKVRITIWIPILFIVSILLSMAYNQDFSKFETYIVLVCTLLSAYVVATCFSHEHIFSAYSNIMFVIAAIGIVGYVWINIGNSIPFAQTFIGSNSLHSVYHSIYVFNWIDGLKERNCGVFWEPGIFASHLVLALQVELCRSKKRWAVIATLVLATITCNSSAGFFLLVIVFAEFLLGSNKNNKSFLQISFNVFIIVVLAVIILNLDNIIVSLGLDNNEYVSKLLSDNVKASTRYKSIFYNLKMFASSPLFGTGLTGSVKEVINTNLTPDTTTSLYVMNTFGIVGAFVTALIVRGILKVQNESLLFKCVFLVILLVIINKETHYAMMLMWYLVFYYNCNGKNTILFRSRKNQ